MVYNPGIPQPKDVLSNSQGDLLTNFGQLNTVYGSSGDHVAFNAATDRGKHKKSTFVSQGTALTDAPATLTNEMALFALKIGTTTELYTRPEESGTVQQITKGGELFMGMHPVFGINISDATPNSNVGAGTYNFTVNNSYNLDTANTRRRTASRCSYRFYFTNGVLDAAGAPTNKYIFYANGFDNSSNPVVGKTPNNVNYDSVVNTQYIDIDFVNQNNTIITSLTGGVIMCWRFQ